jgi:hypothetical protein
MIVMAFPNSVPVGAQSGAAERPAEIRLGACASAGDVVAPLSPLVLPSGELQGQDGAMPAAQSVSVVPVPLSTLLGDGHLIVVFASPEESDVPVSCGDIGGAIGPDGALAVGLHAVNGSKLDGAAYFAPTQAGDETTVTLLLMVARGERERPERDAASDAPKNDRASANDDIARANEDGIAGTGG